jgi:hypothetical protein
VAAGRMVAVTSVSPDGTEAVWAGSPGPVAVVRGPVAAWAACWTEPLTWDVAVWRTGATLLLTPVTGLLTVLATDPTTGLAAGLATVLLTRPLTLLAGLLTVAGTLTAGDCFGLALAAVPGVVPVLWPTSWPGAMSWVTAWTTEVTALVAVGAGGACVLPPDAGGAGALAAGAFTAGTAGTLAAGA